MMSSPTKKKTFIQCVCGWKLGPRCPVTMPDRIQCPQTSDSSNERAANEQCYKNTNPRAHAQLLTILTGCQRVLQCALVPHCDAYNLSLCICFTTMSSWHFYFPHYCTLYNQSHISCGMNTHTCPQKRFTQLTAWQKTDPNSCNMLGFILATGSIAEDTAYLIRIHMRQETHTHCRTQTPKACALTTQ